MRRKEAAAVSLLVLPKLDEVGGYGSVAVASHAACTRARWGEAG